MDPSMPRQTSFRGHVDALIVGGGFYGCSIALTLRELGLKSVLLIEREPGLMGRASYANQARLHNGYHYPRSLTTAYRSRVNLPRFVTDHPECVVDRVQSLYCVARRNSKVTARQFAKFCQQIGAEARPAPASLARLFDERAIEATFLVSEYAFDSTKLRSQVEAQLAAAGVEVRLATSVGSAALEADGPIIVETESATSVEAVATDWLFNCTYAGLNRLDGLGRTAARLKFEITEMVLIDMPDDLADLAVTVMDGPFFSTLPFPDRGLHTLSHVRYTPHFSWTSEEAPDADPYAVLAAYGKTSRAGQMMRDVRRYMPGLASAEPVDSLFEVKTVLLANEVDDGRPILFEQHPRNERCVSVLGGKIDNVYDVCQALQEVPLHG
jgi:glycine/D-amino acid oxidase-like deaminating enzyme